MSIFVGPHKFSSVTCAAADVEICQGHLTRILALLCLVCVDRFGRLFRNRRSLVDFAIVFVLLDDLLEGLL